MSTITQRTFAGGEIAPALHARVDTVKYATACKTMRNMYVMRHGGATNRAGFSFVGEVKDSTKAVRLIEFIFNNEQTYVLEFGHQYMRPIKNGTYLFDVSPTITAISQASEAVVTSNSHGLSDGDTVLISGVQGMTILNYQYFKVSDSTTNTFKIKYLDGTYVNSSGFSAYSSGGAASRIYEIATSYDEADLFRLNYVQSADVMTIVHPDYPPAELSRTGDTSWAIADVDFAPGVGRPNGIGATVSYSGAAGSNTAQYMVTQVSKETGEESWPTFWSISSITSATAADPVVVTTSAAHGLADGQWVQITSDMSEIHERFFSVNVLTSTTFELNGENGTGRVAGTSGSVLEVSRRLTSLGTLSTANVVTLNWTPSISESDRGFEYNVYREDNTGGRFGFVGVATGPTFRDIGYEPDYADAPSLFAYQINFADKYPAAVAYANQRLAYGGSNDDSENIKLSRVSHFRNFSTRSPIQADDAISFSLVGRSVNAIKHLIEVGRLFIFTTGGEHIVQGGDNGVITPTAINRRQITYNGSGDLRPIVVNSGVLYVQNRGSVVRELIYSEDVGRPEGSNLTEFVSHLIDGYDIVDWAYQQVPHSVVWAVRDDGVLIAMTYNKAQEILGWHRHDTDGLFESVCVVPEGSTDVLYAVVKRTVDGRDVRYVERMNVRRFDSIENAVFLDAAISRAHSSDLYDGVTMTLSEYSSGGWDFDSIMTLTCSASYFVAGDVGDEIHLTGSDGTLIRFTIDTYVSGTVVRGRPHKTVPVAMRSVAIANTEWQRAIKTVQNLWHLEGESVAVFADGYVVANPLNSEYTVYTVANGQITLDRAYVTISIGLPYISDLETLDIDSNDLTLADRSKLVSAVTLHVEDTRGVWVGAAAPSDDDTDPLEGLTELKIRDTETYEEPVALTTDKVDLSIRAEWNSNGRVFIRQIDPLPMTILAVSPSGWINSGR